MEGKTETGRAGREILRRRIKSENGRESKKYGMG